MHIGLFDSGVGGLTVLKAMQARMPQARYTYLGDTARLPYGNKAPDTLLKYSLENIEFLEKQGVDAIVVACHSASSVVLDLEKTKAGTPLYNVISPSCQEAIEKSHTHRIGVLSTKATANSHVYPSYIMNLDEGAQVTSQACPLLVPLVEEGMIEDEITVMALKRYLRPLLDVPVDTLILGCTHYPFLSNEITKITGPDVNLINPAESVSQAVEKLGLPPSHHPEIAVYLTDHAPHFIDHAQSLLGQELEIQ